MKVDKLLLLSYSLGFILMIKRTIAIIILAYEGEFVDGWAVDIAFLMMFTGLIIKHSEKIWKSLLYLLLALFIWISLAFLLTIFVFLSE